MEYPLTTEIPHDDPRYVAQLSNFYLGWQARLTELARGEDVIVLCEGDPFFYGSFMHLYVRLQQEGVVPVEVLPGIPGMVGCWHATGEPITWGDDVLSVMTGDQRNHERRAGDAAARCAGALPVFCDCDRARQWPSPRQ